MINKIIYGQKFNRLKRDFNALFLLFIVEKVYFVDF
jgi:hypothetical protein